MYVNKNCSFHTGCASHFENPTNFKILKEPLLLQKQTLHQQKALNLSYLEPEVQGRGITMWAWRCHRRQRVKNPKRGHNIQQNMLLRRDGVAFS